MRTKLELTTSTRPKKTTLLTLSFLFNIIEGLETYLKPQRPGRQIRSRNRENYIVQNSIENFVRNNDRCYIVPASNITQHKNTFFPKTIVDWNHLSNDTVHAKSIDSFRTKIKKECQ